MSMPHLQPPQIWMVPWMWATLFASVLDLQDIHSWEPRSQGHFEGTWSRKITVEETNKGQVIREGEGCIRAVHSFGPRGQSWNASMDELNPHHEACTPQAEFDRQPRGKGATRPEGASQGLGVQLTGAGRAQECIEQIRGTGHSQAFRHQQSKEIQADDSESSSRPENYGAEVGKIPRVDPKELDQAEGEICRRKGKGLREHQGKQSKAPSHSEGDGRKGKQRGRQRPGIDRDRGFPPGLWFTSLEQRRGGEGGNRRGRLYERFGGTRWNKTINAALREAAQDSEDGVKIAWEKGFEGQGEFEAPVFQWLTHNVSGTDANETSVEIDSEKGMWTLWKYFLRLQMLCIFLGGGVLIGISLLSMFAMRRCPPRARHFRWIGDRRYAMRERKGNPEGQQLRQYVFMWLLMSGHVEGLTAGSGGRVPHEPAGLIEWTPTTEMDFGVSLPFNFTHRWHDHQELLYATIQQSRLQRQRQQLQDERITRQSTTVRDVDGLFHELVALHGQNREGIVKVTMYGLGEVHEATRQASFQLDQVNDIWELMSLVKRTWMDLVAFEDFVDVCMVEPQLPPHWTGGEERLHLLVDLQPDRGGLPTLVMNFLQIYGEVEPHGFEARAHRADVGTTCRNLFMVNFYSQVCDYPHVECRCARQTAYGFDAIQEEWLPSFRGRRFDIRTAFYYDNFDNLEEDTTILMTRPVRSRGSRQGSMLPRWAHVYKKGVDEPIFIQRDHDDPSEVLDNIKTRMKHNMRTPDEVSIYELQPQPRDMGRHDARGYAAILRAEENPSHSILVIDFDFYTNSPPGTVRATAAKDGWRETLVTGSSLTRREFLLNIGLAAFCLNNEDRCIVEIGGFAWTTQDPLPRILHNGYFGIISILQRFEDIPLQDQWRWAQCGVQAQNFHRQQTLERQNQRRQREEINATSDESSLLTRWTRWSVAPRPSNAVESGKRLPPPGNGPVAFENEVEHIDRKGERKVVLDRAIDNDFIYDSMAELRGMDVGNDFLEGFLQGLRYESCVKQTGSDKEGEMNSTGNPGESSKEMPEVNDLTILPIEVKLDRCVSGMYNTTPRDGTMEDQKGIDVRQVILLKERMEGHCTIPEFDIEDIPWKPTSIPWVNASIWQLASAWTFAFYVDGSVGHDALGASCVLFVQDENGWHFGGYVRQKACRKGSSFDAELMAQCIAAKWCWDLLRIMRGNGLALPDLWLVFDSQSAAFSVDGRWRHDVEDPIFGAARAFQYAIRTQFGLEFEMYHQRSHQGEAGNEAADVLASHALNLPNESHFWRQFFEKGTVEILNWLWIMYRPDIYQNIQKGFWHLPKPHATMNAEVLRDLQPLEDDGMEGKKLRWCLRLASHNVMSIGAGGGTKAKKGPGALEAFCQQMASEVHLFSLQETRMKRPPSKCQQDFFFVHSAPTSEGQGGILVGFNRKMLLTGKDEDKVRFQEGDVSIIHADAHLMLLRIRNVIFDFVMITGQAPHTGNSEETIRAWWSRAGTLIPNNLKMIPRLFCGDANGKVGDIPSDSVGPWQCEVENEGGHAFHDYLQREDLWLPATFGSCQEGPGWSWCHPNGQTSRIDYFAAPKAWFDFEFHTWMQRDSVINSLLHDHSMVRATCWGWKVCKEGKKEKKKANMFELDLKDQASMEILEWKIKQQRPPSWEMDIHTQVHDLQKSITELTFGTMKAKPKLKKEYLGRDTQAKIKEKRKAKEYFFECKEWLRWWSLKMVFDGWRGGEEECRISQQEFRRSRRSLAQASWNFRSISMDAQDMVRRDDTTFFEALLQRFNDYDCPTQQKQFWKEIRRHMKKTKERRDNPKATANENLRGQWVSKLCELEMGEVMEAERLYELCISRQNEQERTYPTLQELPSLLQIENTLKKTKPGKAPGPDKILPDLIKAVSRSIAPRVWEVAVKSACWGSEPLQWKGGQLVHLLKPGGSRNQIDSHRGVMLTSAIGKRVQSIGREQLIGALRPKCPRGQLGGFKHQEVAFGSHTVRALSRTMYSTKTSFAVIYVDGSNAYHALLRSLVVGLDKHTTDEYLDMKQRLLQQGMEIFDESHPAVSEGALKRLGVSEHLHQVMAEANQDTWAVLEQSIVRTQRGSRPGSPLADALYMVTMHEACHGIQEIIDGDEDMEAIRNRLGIDLPVIVWADDVAILLAGEDSERLEKKVADVMAYTQKTLERRGLKVNYKRGKTETVITPAGVNAKKMRQQMLSTGDPNIPIEGKEGMAIRVQGQYRHLGCIQSAAGEIGQELRFRVAQTWKGFRELRGVLCRRTYNVQTRLRLAEALLWTKLFFGAGAWGPLRFRQRQVLEKCYFGILRAITGHIPNRQQKERPWSNERILAFYGIPDVQTRLSGFRLLYGRRLFLFGGDSLLQAVTQEKARCSGSWLEGLEKDIIWMNEVNGPKWGSSLDQVVNNWKNRTPGWKSSVRRAEKRHTLQRNVKFWLGTKLPEEVIDGSQEWWQCDCGEVFSSWRALRTHEHRKHGKYSKEYGVLQGTTCPCCLRQVWTKERLKQHVRYRYQDGGNRCAAYIFSIQWQQQGAEETPSLPMMGMKRRDFVQCAGPLNFGAEERHEVYLAQQQEHLHEKLKEKGIENPWTLKADHVCDTVLQWMENDERKWIDNVVENLASEECFRLTFCLLFAGAKHQWQDRQAQEEWKDFVLALEGGDLLYEWFDLNLRAAFIERMDESLRSMPTRLQRKSTGERAVNRVQFEFTQRVSPPSGTGTGNVLDWQSLQRLFCRGASLSGLLKAWRRLKE